MSAASRPKPGRSGRSGRSGQPERPVGPEPRIAPVAVPPRATPPRWAVPASLGLCVVGLGVSAFLAYESATASVILACPVNGAIDCGKVTTSAWSKLFGIPVSYLGLLFFIGMIALCTKAAWTRGSALVHNLRLGGTVVGVAMVLYLVWAELFRIGAICLWCTVVHVVSFALFCVVLFARVLAEPTPAATLRR